MSRMALVIFHETTVAAIQSNFPDEKSTVEFLELFSKWWVISNSKTALNTNNYLGNTAVNGDQKPSFLRAWLNGFKQGKQKEFPTSKSLL